MEQIARKDLNLRKLMSENAGVLEKCYFFAVKAILIFFGSDGLENDEAKVKHFP